MVYIHLINQGGRTGALTVFIVIPFFACAEGGGGELEGSFQHKQFCSLQE